MNADRSFGALRRPGAADLSRRSGFAAVSVLALALLTLVATITPAAAARRAGGVVTVSFVNNSDRDLIGVGMRIAHGCLSAPAPGRIAAGTTGTWTSTPCNDPEGTEGTLTYQIEGEGSAATEVGWNVPVIGANTYTEKAPNGYVISHTGGGEAAVQFTFDCNSTTCDGIPDDWKRNGVTIDVGGVKKFIDLPKMGADVNKPDIFLQVDWMAGTAHSHALDPAAIKKVVDAFANSPYNRHSPTTGINLHIDAGPTSIMNFATNTTWGDLSRAKQLTETANLGTADANGMYQWDAFNKLKTGTDGFGSTGRATIFHYAISAHNLQSGSHSSGISAGTPGSDLIVSMGSFTNQVGTVNEQAGTLMHELGHNLGLRHGGAFDLPNHKPQYFSVMNYSYQMGLAAGTTTGLIDYSRQGGDIDENALNERVFPSSSQNYDVSHYCKNPTGGGSFVTVLASKGAIDWNCDGTVNEADVVYDTNNDMQNTTLSGTNDWSALQLRGGSIGHPANASGVHAPTEENELTVEEAAMELPLDMTPPVTTAKTINGGDEHWGHQDEKNGAHHEQVLVRLLATDDLSGVASTQYNLDGEGWTNYTGLIKISGEGEHTLLYRSTDHAQNLEETKSLTVTVEPAEEEERAPSRVG